MTELGCEVWEEHGRRIGIEPTDWGTMWSGFLNHETGKGYVVASRMERCEAALAEWSEKPVQNDHPILFDRSSFQVSEVQQWKPAYYKTLQGGVRIDFRFVEVDVEASWDPS